MPEEATLSAKFQISIPKAIRTAQNWRAGQRFVFLTKGSAVLLVPAPSRDELSGIASGASTEDPRDRNDRC